MPYKTPKFKRPDKGTIYYVRSNSLNCYFWKESREYSTMNGIPNQYQFQEVPVFQPNILQIFKCWHINNYFFQKPQHWLLADVNSLTLFHSTTESIPHFLLSPKILFPPKEHCSQIPHYLFPSDRSPSLDMTQCYHYPLNA